NLTVTAATAAGNLVSWDSGPFLPDAPSLSFAAGHTVANQAIVRVGPGGYIGIRNASWVGSVQVIADVAGYYLAGTPQTAGTFQVLAPARVLSTTFLNNATGPVPPGGSLQLFVGEAGVPLSGVDAVALHVTASGGNASGHLTVFASGTTRPGVS